MAGWRLDDVITKEHIMKLVNKQKELNFNPGDKFWYCNTGFTLLAEVVARVSGMSFAEFTSEHIFKPLGMSNTLFYGDLIKSYCVYYEIQPEIFVKTIMTDDKSYAEAPETSQFLPAQVLATEFEAKGLGASLTSFKKENGKTKNVIILTPGQKILELEAQGFDPDSVNLNEFSGNFYSPELSTTYTFIVRDGKLVATHPRLSDFVLIAVRPDFFQSKQWFFSQIVFIRDANKNIIGCTVSSERIKNLWFKKMK